ncbi:OPT/YSL family transporter, partial [bacterium]|nr:OPT/YSL family transporter [bacterium]
EALPAPQANAMAAVIEPLMTGQPAPWLLYMAGVFMALILQWTGLPALAFALGMYLPLSVNTPVLAGGLIAHWVAQGGTEKQQKKRNEKGTLMASGFVAGGAIMGVIAALVRFTGISTTGDQEWTVDHAIGLSQWATENAGSAVVTLVVFCLLGFYLYKGARNAGND